ncbi:MAG: hypothetical protein DRP37_07840 [Thermodesulfobacteriota bacterium]|nr:MAG: hypothetical protein DRP37_07840 [Thermodesulfobacteriota bacterium]
MLFIAFHNIFTSSVSLIISIRYKKIFFLLSYDFGLYFKGGVVFKEEKWVNQIWIPTSLSKVKAFFFKTLSGA